MTKATREALENVQRILHEAGWDEPASPAENSLTAEEESQILRAFEALLPRLRQVLEKRLVAEEAEASKHS